MDIRTPATPKEFQKDVWANPVVICDPELHKGYVHLFVSFRDSPTVALSQSECSNEEWCINLEPEHQRFVEGASLPKIHFQDPC